MRVVVEQRALAVRLARAEHGEDLVLAAVPLADLDAAAHDDAELAAGLALAEDVRAGQIADGAREGRDVRVVLGLQLPADHVLPDRLEDRVLHGACGVEAGWRGEAAACGPGAAWEVKCGSSGAPFQEGAERNGENAESAHAKTRRTRSQGGESRERT